MCSRGVHARRDRPELPTACRILGHGSWLENSTVVITIVQLVLAIIISIIVITRIVFVLAINIMMSNSSNNKQ